MEELRAALVAAGLDEEGIGRAFGAAPSAEAARLHARRAGAALVRLFVLGDDVGAAELPVDADTLTAAGLVERNGGAVRAPLLLDAHEGLLVAHDRDERIHEDDYVPGVNNASRTLASLTIRVPVERALDVGTGCGVQALLAARHARTVVATDVSRWALRYAELNGRLNGVAIDLREGSWFDPVAGERFDLVVANPPFVISPDTRYVFRDAGDDVSREVVRGAAAHLREGGYATVLCNWAANGVDETWQQLGEWVEGTGCDALLLAHEPVEPFHYAARWNEPLRADEAAYERAVERWLDYYEREGIRGIGIGAVVLRRRDGESRRRGYDLARPATGAAGEQLLRLFRALDEPGDDLLDARVRLVPGHRLEQTLVYAEAYEPVAVAMTLDEGVGLVAHVDAHPLPVLFALDPARTLGAVVSEVGADTAEVLPTLLRLYELGFLERVG